MLVEEYDLFIEDKALPGAGYGFPCRKDGEIIAEKLCQTAKNSLKYVRESPDYRSPVIKDFSRYVTNSAIGECEQCEGDVYLSNSLNNECEICGANYNMSGQRIKAIKDQFDKDGLTPDTRKSYLDIYGQEPC